ncbi:MULTISPECIES: hypothetical protein [Nostocaceae]|nr:MULTISPECIES: hypothetical protein [Nostocaceae]
MLYSKVESDRTQRQPEKRSPITPFIGRLDGGKVAKLLSAAT